MHTLLPAHVLNRQTTMMKSLSRYCKLLPFLVFLMAHGAPLLSQEPPAADDIPDAATTASAATIEATAAANDNEETTSTAIDPAQELEPQVTRSPAIPADDSSGTTEPVSESGSSQPEEHAAESTAPSPNVEQTTAAAEVPRQLVAAHTADIATSRPQFHSVILRAPLDAPDFAALAQPLAQQAESVRPAGDDHIVVTGTSETITAIEKLAGELTTALETTRQQLSIRASLLVSPDKSGAGDDASTTAITRDETLKRLAEFGIDEKELAGIRLPDQMLPTADAALPFTSAGRLVLPLGDFLLRATQVGSDATSIELDLTLTEESAPAENQLVLMHRFRANRGKAVVMGVSTPARTLILVLRLEK